MSKNIVIQEGGIGKQLTVDKLKTDLVGGGSCLWVPEDGTTLGTKNINADGTYKASSDGLYGYSEVTVHGTGKATGKDSDGDKAYTYTDPSTGRLVTDKLPSSLVVETNPSKMTYYDGETLDFTGMVVKGYLESGGLWTDSSHPNGVIPVSELVFPVTTADYSQVHTSEYSDGQGINATRIEYLPHWNLLDAQGHEELIFISQPVGIHNGDPSTFGANSRGGGPTVFYATVYNGNLYTWGATSAQNLNRYQDTGEEYFRYQMYSGTSATASTGDAKSALEANELEYIAESTAQPQGRPNVQPVAEYQEIPVQWMYPNGDVVETSFRITVVPSN